MRTRLALAALALGLAAGGCRSHKKSGPETGSGAAPAPVPAAGSNSPPATPGGSTNLDGWDEPTPPPTATASLVPPAGQADRDALIARSKAQCPKGANSASCQQMRGQLERILLDDIVGLRAGGKDIDRRWYRVAARAELPQLACIGVRELIFAPDRTPEDVATIVAALDSPYRLVRDVALWLDTKVPAVTEARQRSLLQAPRDATMCIGGLRDRAPDGKWAGGYPSARFRYFASDPTRRWFTTSDPVDKVLEYFTKSGRPALTKDQLAMAQAQRFADEANKITAATAPGDEDKAAAKIQQLLMRQPADVSSLLGRLENIGEIRYVMISPSQPVAIFKDDLLHATSIVALRAPAPPR